MQNTNNNILKIKINIVISTCISFTKLIIEQKQLIYIFFYDLYAQSLELLIK